MLVIMKRVATESNLEQVKKILVEQDCDFHQSTGADRIILGVVGETKNIDPKILLQIPGVLDIYRIPDENESG
ncbi:hypothetical protein [uncultured Desulfuromusa sp.]|uniref:hypothetical protein n=1 Tax=uncultured Desulfuromusa sp. TaxID=219183 RepID=UPI002AA9249A|nr:hypothetical protein [uncultured Desulfuromusa sp.]